MIMFLSLLAVTCATGVGTVYAKRHSSFTGGSAQTDEVNEVVSIDHAFYGPIKVPNDHESANSDKVWRKDVVMRMAQYYVDGTDFLDIGAAMGLDALGLHKTKAITGTCHCIEACRNAMSLCNYNTQQIPRTRLYPVALGTLPGVQLPLDVIEFPNRISLIKVDAEPEVVIKCAKKTIMRHQPVIIVIPTMTEKISSVLKEVVNYVQLDDNVYVPVLKIMQTHKYMSFAECPDVWQQAMRSWIDKPTIKHTYINNDDCVGYIRSNYIDERVARAYETLDRGAFKADLVRYCWMYTEGGLYADADTVCLQNDLRGWLNNYLDVDIILTKDTPSSPRALYQAFIYCRQAGQDLFKKCIDIVCRNVLEIGQDKFGGYSVSGPNVVYEALCEIDPSFADRDLPVGKIEIQGGVKLLIMDWNMPQPWDEHAATIVDDAGRSVFLHKSSGIHGNTWIHG